MMKYPKLNNYIEFTFIEKDNNYIVDNHLTDERYIMKDPTYYNFIISLDGRTDPYKEYNFLPEEEISQLLNELETLDFIRYSRFLILDFTLIMYSVVILDKSINKFKKYAQFMNRILHFGSLPIFFIGLLLYNNCLGLLQLNSYNGFAFIVSVLLSAILHELAHACSAVNYDAPVFEFGIGLEYGIMPMAYTLFYDKNNEIKERIQITFAGIQANVLLCGIALILASIFKQYLSVLNAFAYCNILISFLNILPCFGTDGYKIILYLLGIDENIDFINVAKNIIKGKNISNHDLLKYSIYFTIFSMLIFQCGFFALLLFSIYGVIFL